MQSADKQAPSGDTAALFRRVLVPVDFSMLSHRAVFAALDFRRLFGATVCVYNVTHEGETAQFLAGLGRPTTSGDLVSNGTVALQHFVENIAPGQSGAVEYGVRIADDCVDCIRDKASAWDATMLILSCEPHNALLRTHSEKIINSISIPVLLLQ